MSLVSWSKSLIISITVIFTVQVAHAEYYMVSGPSDCVSCRPHHVYKKVYLAKCHYKKVKRKYYRKYYPVKKYYRPHRSYTTCRFYPSHCGARPCYNPCREFVVPPEYFENQQIYRCSQDMATGDDNTCCHPEMQINY